MLWISPGDAMFKQLVLMTIVAAAALLGQNEPQTTVPNPTSTPASDSQQQPEDVGAVFKVEVVARTTQAVNYLHRGGSTKVNFKGTALMPAGKGDATVESEKGVIRISADFRNFVAPQTYGPEYLTYVLWAISPDGRALPLGELTLSEWGMGSESNIKTTSDIQTFGMIVTAEPYYAVTQPSDVVVMENEVRPDTRGVIESVDAKYELLPRGVYTMKGHAPGFVPVDVGKKLPRELLEAENAVHIARVAGADQYAQDSYQKAQDALERAEKYQVQKPGQKPVITMAREAAVRAEDARVIAVKRQIAEHQEQERQAAAAREQAAKERAEAEAQQRAKAEAEARDEAERRAKADAQRLEAEKARADAEAAAQEADRQRAAAEQAKAAAEQAKADADAARQQLALEAEKARQSAAEADRLRQKAEQDQAQLRQALLDQFNQVLQTRDTARGLIINMSDVLFATARWDLKPTTREKLARLSGIILSHPGLRLEVEGYTDNVGSEAMNQRLSERRAGSVREYLITQGIPDANISAKGLGETNFVADNKTAAGRQQNRRVELVVSGEIIGTNINEIRTQPAQPAQQQ
ncbi:MAG TPA: OmpA family protein [Bryobacteraceae bacterium]|nr:OmpA family protein [Bryobacteraceae bacterium]